MGEQNGTTEVVKEKKKWLVPIIVAGAVILVAIVAAIIVMRTLSNPKRLLKNKLDAGQKYLTELDFEKAVLAYKEAISIDAKNVEAYLGLAEAYVATGNYEDAINIINQGIRENQWRRV